MISQVIGPALLVSHGKSEALIWLPKKEEHFFINDAEDIGSYKLGDWVLFDQNKEKIVGHQKECPYETKVLYSDVVKQEFVQVKVPIVFPDKQCEVVAYSPGFGNVGAFVPNLGMDVMSFAWIAFAGFFKNAELRSLMVTLDIKWLVAKFDRRMDKSEIIVFPGKSGLKNLLERCFAQGVDFGDGPKHTQSSSNRDTAERKKLPERCFAQGADFGDGLSNKHTQSLPKRDIEQKENIAERCVAKGANFEDGPKHTQSSSYRDTAERKKLPERCFAQGADFGDGPKHTQSSSNRDTTERKKLPERCFAQDADFGDGLSNKYTQSSSNQDIERRKSSFIPQTESRPCQSASPLGKADPKARNSLSNDNRKFNGGSRFSPSVAHRPFLHSNLQGLIVSVTNNSSTMFVYTCKFPSEELSIKSSIVSIPVGVQHGSWIIFDLKIDSRGEKTIIHCELDKSPPNWVVTPVRNTVQALVELTAFVPKKWRPDTLAPESRIVPTNWVEEMLDYDGLLTEDMADKSVKILTERKKHPTGKTWYLVKVLSVL